eukprot:TRINITY_DN2379_c0_g1_i3.p1 TRINITY_DN2379_c0_g1~~TRINITY_DN2379_c0_g1_i3.p1  ORF type:complete len:1544 (+),score=505.31 TRINITY_DN2379_c0_g1_i3:562-4632(+)
MVEHPEKGYKSIVENLDTIPTEHFQEIIASNAFVGISDETLEEDDFWPQSNVVDKIISFIMLSLNKQRELLRKSCASAMEKQIAKEESEKIKNREKERVQKVISDIEIKLERHHIVVSQLQRRHHNMIMTLIESAFPVKVDPATYFASFVASISEMHRSGRFRAMFAQLQSEMSNAFLEYRMEATKQNDVKYLDRTKQDQKVEQQLLATSLEEIGQFIVKIGTLGDQWVSQLVELFSRQREALTLQFQEHKLKELKFREELLEKEVDVEIEPTKEGRLKELLRPLLERATKSIRNQEASSADLWDILNGISMSEWKHPIILRNFVEIYLKPTLESLTTSVVQPISHNPYSSIYPHHHYYSTSDSDDLSDDLGDSDDDMMFDMYGDYLRHRHHHVHDERCRPSLAALTSSSTSSTSSASSASSTSPLLEKVKNGLESVLKFATRLYERGDYPNSLLILSTTCSIFTELKQSANNANERQLALDMIIDALMEATFFMLKVFENDDYLKDWWTKTLREFAMDDPTDNFVAVNSILQNGWSNSTLQKVLAGDKTVEWKNVEPIRTTKKRIEILRRENRITEGLNLALAANQKSESAELLCAAGRSQEAINIALHNANDASQLMTISKTLGTKYPMGTFILSMEALKLAKPPKEEDRYSSYTTNTIKEKSLTSDTVLSEMARIFLKGIFQKKAPQQQEYFPTLIDLCTQTIANVMMAPGKDLREIREFLEMCPGESSSLCLPDMTLKLVTNRMVDSATCSDLANEISPENPYTGFQLALKGALGQPNSWRNGTAEKMFNLSLTLGSFAINKLVEAVKEHIGKKKTDFPLTLTWARTLHEKEMTLAAYELAKCALEVRMSTLEARDVTWFLQELVRPLKKEGEVVEFFLKFPKLRADTAQIVSKFIKDEKGLQFAHDFLKKQFENVSGPSYNDYGRNDYTSMLMYLRISSEISTKDLKAAASACMRCGESTLMECIKTLYTEQKMEAVKYLAIEWARKLKSKPKEEYREHNIYGYGYDIYGARTAQPVIAKIILQLCKVLPDPEKPGKPGKPGKTEKSGKSEKSEKSEESSSEDESAEENTDKMEISEKSEKMEDSEKSEKSEKSEELPEDLEELKEVRQIAVSSLFSEEPTFEHWTLVKKIWEQDSQWESEKKRLLGIVSDMSGRRASLLHRVKILLSERMYETAIALEISWNSVALNHAYDPTPICEIIQHFIRAKEYQALVTPTERLKLMILSMDWGHGDENEIKRYENFLKKVEPLIEDGNIKSEQIKSEHVDLMFLFLNILREFRPLFAGRVAPKMYAGVIDTMRQIKNIYAGCGEKERWNQKFMMWKKFNKGKKKLMEALTATDVNNPLSNTHSRS